MNYMSIRRFASKVLLGAFVAVTAQLVSAQPYYYTFSGYINNVYDRAGVAANSGASIGDFVSYVFRVDRYSDASVTYNNGGRRVLADTRRIDRFQADLVAGGALDSGNYYERRNIGYADISVGQIGSYGTSLIGGSSDNRVSIAREGRNWVARETATNNYGRQSAVYANVRISDVSRTNPAGVPELDASGAPIAFALITGIAGIAFERRRKKAAA